jgi:hypothetical protein
MGRILTFIVRGFFVVAGLVFAVAIAAAASIALTLWLLRAAWARLTGRPVQPFIAKVDPRRGFRRAARYPQADVVDVEARPVRTP